MPVKLNTLTNNVLYWHLISNIKKPASAVEHWISEYPFLNEIDFEKFYCLPYKILKETKLQAFQYKILHRIVATNDKLFQWGIKESNLCMYCGQHDTISHFFWDCIEVRQFWTSIENWANTVLNLNSKLNSIDILFGIPFNTGNDKMHNINYVILHAKFYIYKMKLDNLKLNLFDFFLTLKDAAIVSEYYTQNMLHRGRMFDYL